MIRGLYTSASGMIVQMNKMDVVSNNIANANTTAFKKDSTVTQAFSQELTKRLDDPKYKLIEHEKPIGKMSLGTFVSQVNTDFSTGSLNQTGGDLDVAIEGDGFFVISVKDSSGKTTEKYSRDGAFSLTADGTLVDKNGNQVMGEKGKITIANGDISIFPNGDIYSGTELVDRLKLVDVENKDSLRKYGDNLYDSIEETKIIPFKGKVLQNYLEVSNVNTVQEMVKMITVSRVYEANSKMIQTHDSTLQRAVNELGKKQ